MSVGADLDRWYVGSGTGEGVSSMLGVECGARLLGMLVEHVAPPFGWERARSSSLWVAPCGPTDCRAAMLPVMTDDDGQRWAEAQVLLDRYPTPPALQQVRRWRGGRRRLVASTVVVGASVAVLVAVVGAAPLGGREVTPTDLQLMSGSVVFAAGVVLLIVGVLGRRGGAPSRMPQCQPLRALTRGQRRRLTAEVRGCRPADPARVPLGRELAARMIEQIRLLPVTGGLVCSQVGLAVVDPDPWRLVATALLVLVFVVAAGLALRDVRRAERFLAEHPTPSAGLSGSTT